MFQKPPSDAKLEEAINRVLLAMQEVSPDSEQYSEMVDQLVKLHTLKVNAAKSRVSKDVLLTVAANLAGILLILQYEKMQIVTSKAMSIVPKLR